MESHSYDSPRGQEATAPSKTSLVSKPDLFSSHLQWIRKRSPQTAGVAQQVQDICKIFVLCSYWVLRWQCTEVRYNLKHWIKAGATSDASLNSLVPGISNSALSWEYIPSADRDSSLMLYAYLSHIPDKKFKEF